MSRYSVTTTHEIDEMAKLFKGGTASSSGGNEISSEVTVSADISAIKDELSKVRHGIEKVLGLLEARQVNGGRKIVKTDFDLDSYIGMWADLSPEEERAFKESFREGFGFGELQQTDYSRG